MMRNRMKSLSNNFLYRFVDVSSEDIIMVNVDDVLKRAQPSLEDLRELLSLLPERDKKTSTMAVLLALLSTFSPLDAIGILESAKLELWAQQRKKIGPGFKS